MTNDLPRKQAIDPPAAIPPVGPRHVSLEIPYEPLLAERIRTLRTQVGLPGDAVSAYPLGVTFNIPDEATWQFFTAILSKIQPLTLSLKQVEAHVEGQQTYRSGWQIDENGQDQLRRLRTGLITSLKSAPVDLVPLGSLLLVAENVAAGAFPALVAAMQRDFEPITWSINTVRMVVETTVEKRNVDSIKKVDIADSTGDGATDDVVESVVDLTTNDTEDVMNVLESDDLEDDDIDEIKYVDDID